MKQLVLLLFCKLFIERSLSVNLRGIIDFAVNKDN
jgi:hypothetical protein